MKRDHARMKELFQEVLAEPSISKRIDDIVPRVNPQHDLHQLKLLIAEKKLDLHSGTMMQTWSGELAPYPRRGESMSVSISLLGHESTLPWYKKWLKNVARNLPTFFSAVITAIVVSWAIYGFGAPNTPATQMEEELAK